MFKVLSSYISFMKSLITLLHIAAYWLLLYLMFTVSSGESIYFYFGTALLMGIITFVSWAIWRWVLSLFKH
jgi:hypothetical protein